MTKLLLFDIDGTLVLTGGAGGRAMARAFADVFGFSNGLGSISMAGRTDAWIVAQMAAEHGLDVRRRRSRAFPRQLRRVISPRKSSSPGRGRACCPACAPLLDALGVARRCATSRC